MKTLAEIRLEQGARYPYDAPDAEDAPASAAADWAHLAARGVVADLKDRRAIKWGFDNIDEAIRASLIADLADIIRTAAPMTSPTQDALS